MAKRQVSISGKMLITWFMLAGLILLFSPQNLTNKFQFAFARLFRWPLTISRSVSLSARMPQSPRDIVSRGKFNQLQNHLVNVIEQRDQIHKKYEMLSGLRDRYALEGADIVVADVITGTADGSHNELVINRGEKDGLVKGQFVLGDNSVIGTVYSISSRNAQIKLISDPASSIAVKISNSKAVMTGSGDSTAKVVLSRYKVNINTEVFALRKHGLLDTPFITGIVVRCEQSNENPLLWDIVIEPACDIERLTTVAVIIMKP